MLDHVDTLTMTVSEVCRRLDETACDLLAFASRAEFAVGGAEAARRLLAAADLCDAAQRRLQDGLLLGG